MIEKLVQHKIDGKMFLSLNDEYLWETVPSLGDRLKIKKLINQLLVTDTMLTVSLMSLLINAHRFELMHHRH